MSIISTSGRTDPSNLSERDTRPYLLLVALKYVSTEGVAEPSSVLAPCMDASTIAASRALYLGAGSYCLKEASCSSSTITRPSCANGRNIEDLTPRLVPDVDALVVGKLGVVNEHRVAKYFAEAVGELGGE